MTSQASRQCARDGRGPHHDLRHFTYLLSSRITISSTDLHAATFGYQGEHGYMNVEFEP